MVVSTSDAATSVILPNGDITTQWTECNGTAVCASPRYTYIDEDVASPNNMDFIGTGTEGASVDAAEVEFALGTVQNVTSVSNLQIRLNARSMTNANGGTLDDLDVQLRIGGVLQAAQRVTPPFSLTSWTTYSLNFSGAWTQADLDGAQVVITRVQQGGGNRIRRNDNVQISALSVTATYTSPVPAAVLDQSGYRWFANQDAASASNPSFGPRTRYNIGQSAVFSSRKADVNNDGVTDLITANAGAQNASVLIGNGDGTFKAAVHYGVGVGPRTLDVGDITGDGLADIITANYDSGSISVLVNNGNGAYASKVDYALPSGNPQGVFIGNIDNQGLNDVLVSNFSGNATMVYTNNGDGSLTLANTYANAGAAETVFAADIDADGDLDMATASQNIDTVSIRRNNGNGTFAANTDYAVGTDTVSVLLVDVNNDSSPDLIASNEADSTMVVYLNNGSGIFTFNASYPTATLPRELSFGDYTGDGVPDITLGHDGQPLVYLFRNNGSGGLTSSTLTVPSTSYTAQIMDANNDGKSDVVATDNGDLSANVFLNTTTPSTMNVGTPLAATNSSATVQNSAEFRLRSLLHVNSGTLAESQSNIFRLQFAEVSSATPCSSVSNASYAMVTSTSAIRYFINPLAYNSAPLVTNANDPIHSGHTTIRQVYRESPTVLIPVSNDTVLGQDAMWDFALKTSGNQAGKSFCLRYVFKDGTQLASYTVYPRITIAGGGPSLNQQLRGGQSVLNGVKSPLSF